MKRTPVTRKKKIEAEMPKPSAKDKFFADIAEEEVMRQAPVAKFVPATQNQKKAVAMLRDGVRVLFLQGSAGTGKSMLAAWWAATLMKEKKIEKIYLVRPNVATGRSAGSLPGTEEEKLAPFFAQTVSHLSTFMGAGFMNYCLRNELIEYKSAEYMRGRSFENVAILAEEVQNFDASDMEMLLTRLGKGTTYLMTGDGKQNDMRGNSGLEQTIALINRMVDEQPDYLSDEDLDNLQNLVGSVTFLPGDCVRDGITRSFVKMYYHN
jgi:phosphate starvation-inducible PhoH-like protein